jgi:tetratricopeptide (TPR) repeat protein
VRNPRIFARKRPFSYVHQFTRDTHLRARDLFRHAIELEPQLAEAHVWLARVNGGLVAYGWSVAPEIDLREGMQAAFEAIRLDQRSPYAHFALAIVSVFAGELPQAVRAGEAAIELGPSFALGYMVLGMARLFSGHAAEAIAPIENVGPACIQARRAVMCC